MRQPFFSLGPQANPPYGKFLLLYYGIRTGPSSEKTRKMIVLSKAYACGEYGELC
jgi:hypothetical protein